MSEKNIKKLLRALIEGPIQQLENTWMALLTERRIDNAVGAQLDLLGKMVGQKREGRDDDIYRRFIRARIATNNSDGLVEDEIKVTKLVLDDESVYVHVRPVGTATIAVTLEDGVIDYAIAEIVYEFAQAAAGAGVRVLVEYWPDVEANLFTFAAFAGQAQLGKGFGSTQVGHTTEGGVLAGSIG